MTKIYHYDDHGAFLHESDARIDPEVPGRPVVPAKATLDPPPQADPGYVAVFSDDGWVIVEDHRGATVYGKVDRSPEKIVAPGPIPDTHTPLVPSEDSEWDADAGEWVVPPPPPPTADDVRAEAARRLRRTDWYVVRAADPSDGTPIPQTVLDYRAAVRAASNTMEADPPTDYADDAHWPEAVS